MPERGSVTPSGFACRGALDLLIPACASSVLPAPRARASFPPSGEVGHAKQIPGPSVHFIHRASAAAKYCSPGIALSFRN